MSPADGSIVASLLSSDDIVANVVM
jgi:hypothetical protein